MKRSMTASPQRCPQGVRQRRFLICLPNQLEPCAAPTGPVAKDRERGSDGAVRLAQKAREGECGEIRGELPTRLGPGGWARVVASQAWDARSPHLREPRHLDSTRLLAG
eukprot:2405945-Pyramimonas_sp.AAC.1